MSKVKVITAQEAACLIKDNDTVVCSGFIASGIPEALETAVEERFAQTGFPRDLTVVYVAGTGNQDGTSIDHFAHEGLVKRVIGGHYNMIPNMGKLLSDNKIEGYNIPQGALASMMRDSAAHRIGTITSVGIGTFADPRNGGGRLSERTTEDICKIIELEGEEQLFYPRLPMDVALIRGTYADEDGNVTCEKEVAPLDATSQAMAVHNNGGTVIVQVEKVVCSGQLDPKLVKIPGIYVDYVVVCPAEDPKQFQSLYCAYNPAYAGNYREPAGGMEPKPLDAKKIIGRQHLTATRKDLDLMP